jgi:hypothetical protein
MVDCKCKSCGCGKMQPEEMWNMIEDQTLPFYEETVDHKTVIRHFKPGYPEHLFKWHFDREDRVIEVLEDSDWKFQYDNEMPILLNTETTIEIKAGVYHRVIPGSTKLSLKINKIL